MLIESYHRSSVRMLVFEPCCFYFPHYITLRRLITDATNVPGRDISVPSISTLAVLHLRMMELHWTHLELGLARQCISPTSAVIDRWGCITTLYGLLLQDLFDLNMLLLMLLLHHHLLGPKLLILFHLLYRGLGLGIVIVKKVLESLHGSTENINTSLTIDCLSESTTSTVCPICGTEHWLEDRTLLKQLIHISWILTKLNLRRGVLEASHPWQHLLVWVIEWIARKRVCPTLMPWLKLGLELGVHELLLL